MPPAAATAPPKKPDFAPPRVEVGMTVQWRNGPDSEDYTAAIVQGVGDRSLDLLVLPIGYYAGFNKNGVHHEDDPLLRKNPNRAAEGVGVWRHMPLTVELLALAEDLSTKPGQGK